MKQRLVGTLVLGCLALIFIPLLLDGDGISPSSDIASIPPEPDLAYSDLSPPQIPQPDTAAPGTDASAAQDSTSAEISLPAAEPAPIQASAETGAANADTSAASADAITASKAAMGADGLPEAWSIRLGIFGERANADALLRKLLDAGYKAYSRPVPTAQGSLTGIFVGPVLTRTEASALVQECAQKFKVNGIVVQFKVEELQ